MISMFTVYLCDTCPLHVACCVRQSSCKFFTEYLMPASGLSELPEIVRVYSPYWVETISVYRQVTTPLIGDKTLSNVQLGGKLGQIGW